MLTTMRTTHGIERGFGLVELIIVCALTLVALTMVSSFLLSSWQTSKQAVGTGNVQARSNDLLAQLGADVRQAMAVARGGTGATDAQLRELAATGAPSSLSDVVYATTTQLWFVSDVDAGSAGASPARECVGYVDTAGALVRRVLPASSCTGTMPPTGTPLDETEMMRSNGKELPGPRFRYVLEYNPDVRTSTGAVNIANCRQWRGVALTATGGFPAEIGSVARARAAIVGVQVDASAFERAGAQAFEAESSFSITSRRTSAYRKALGCAY